MLFMIFSFTVFFSSLSALCYALPDSLWIFTLLLSLGPFFFGEDTLLLNILSKHKLLSPCGGFSSFLMGGKMADHRGNFPMRLMKMTMMHWCSFFFLCQMHLSLSSFQSRTIATLHSFFSVSRKSLSNVQRNFPTFPAKACASSLFFTLDRVDYTIQLFGWRFFAFPKKKATTEPHRPREKSDSAYIRRARTHKTTHDRETVDDDVGDGGDI